MTKLDMDADSTSDTPTARRCGSVMGVTSVAKFTVHVIKQSDRIGYSKHTLNHAIQLTSRMARDRYARGSSTVWSHHSPTAAAEADDMTAATYTAWVQTNGWWHTDTLRFRCATSCTTTSTTERRHVSKKTQQA